MSLILRCLTFIACFAVTSLSAVEPDGAVSIGPLAIIPPSVGLESITIPIRAGSNPPGGMGKVTLGAANLEIISADPTRYIADTPALTGTSSLLLWREPVGSNECRPGKKRTWTWEVVVHHPNAVMRATFRGLLPPCAEGSGEVPPPVFDGIVVHVDLDVDSRNVSAGFQRPPARTDVDDAAEEIAPGALVFLNTDYHEGGRAAEPPQDDWQRPGVVPTDPNLVRAVLEIRGAAGTATFTYSDQFIRLYRENGDFVANEVGLALDENTHQFLIEGIKIGPVPLSVTFVPDNGIGKAIDRVLLTVIEIRLTQRNYPTSESTTDLGPRANRLIDRDKIAYINGMPEMPQLVAGIFPAGTPVGPVDWRLEIKTERPGDRGARDDTQFPLAGPRRLPGNQPWQIHTDYEGRFVGGSGTLKARINNAFEVTFPFFIRGKNPRDAIARAFVQANSGGFPYFWAMVQHESRQGDRVYNQFNAVARNPRFLELPNKDSTPGTDGWGLAMIEGANTMQVYNWRSNITGAAAILADKQAATNRFFEAVAFTYPSDPEARNPPGAYTVPGTATAIDARSLSTIVLYNGARGTPFSPLTRPNGTNVTFQNPWTFNPEGNAGEKWQFQDNSNGYAKKVIHDELDGNFAVLE